MKDETIETPAEGSGTQQKKTFDIRVFHDGNKGNSDYIDEVFLKHEEKKKKMPYSLHRTSQGGRNESFPWG